MQLFNIMGHTSLYVVKNKIYYLGKSAQTTLHHRTSLHLLWLSTIKSHILQLCQPTLGAAPKELERPIKGRSTVPPPLLAASNQKPLPCSELHADLQLASVMDTAAEPALPAPGSSTTSHWHF